MNGHYMLICAVRDGRLDRAREIINSYELPYLQEWSEGNKLLSAAAKNGLAAVVKLLVSGNIFTSKRNKFSLTLLHTAAMNGDIEIVKMILNEGAYSDHIDQYGRTPLFCAVINKRVELIELFLRNGADANILESDGTSLLHIAVETGSVQIIEYLLNYGASIDCKCAKKSKIGYAPLHFAVEKGIKEVTTLLLNRGANVNVTADDNITPLHIAAKKGYVHIAQVLLSHGACTDSITFEEGYMPLHFATEEGKTEVVQLLLNRGAPVNASTNSNLTPLFIAIRKRQKSILKLLLQHGGKVDSQKLKGKTALHLAVDEGQLSIVKDVLKFSPNINDQRNKNSLKVAVHGSTKEYKLIVEALQDYGLTFGPEDIDDPKLLHAAVERGYLKIIDDLLKHGADVNMLDHSTYYKDFTPLHSAAKYKQEEAAKLLISYEPDMNAQDNFGRPPLYYAIENADLKIINLLLTNGAKIKNSPELFNLAVKMEYMGVIEVLLQHGADVNDCDEYGRTALHFTALNDEYCNTTPNKDTDNIKGGIAKFLLDKGANVDAEARNRVTTLHAAAQKGSVKVVESLLEYNANVNLVVNNNITPLHLSARQGSGEICLMLLKKGANVNAKQKNGITPLHIASYEGHTEVVKVLLENNANVYSKMYNSLITPLHLAAVKGYRDIVEIILEFGADIDARDHFGRTALHMASQAGHVNVVVSLLDYGSDINITTKDDKTPLDRVLSRIGTCLSRHSPRRRHNKRRHKCSDFDYEDFEGYDADYDDIDNIDDAGTAEVLKIHIVKLKSANLYVTRQDLASIEESPYFYTGRADTDDINEFQIICLEELARMKNDKFDNINISFYDILTKGTSSLAVYMRNENIVQALNSDEYIIKFPLYAGMIECNFRKGMIRNKLLDQCNDIFHSLINNFAELPYDCTEKIFSYLSNEDLRVLVNAFKPLSISNPILALNKNSRIRINIFTLFSFK